MGAGEPGMLSPSPPTHGPPTYTVRSPPGIWAHGNWTSESSARDARGYWKKYCAKHCARDLRAHVVRSRPQGGSGRNSGKSASQEVGRKAEHARGRWLCRPESARFVYGLS